jgi:PAS domain S-box-containing protein
MIKNEKDALEVVSLLDDVSDGIMLLNSEGIIIYINKQAAELLDSDQERLSGSVFSKLESDTIIFELVNDYKQHRKSSSTELELEVGEKPVCIEVKIYGKGDSVIVYFRDVTERKEIEEKYRLAYESIRNLNSHSEKIREDERTQLSREIHDLLGQRLTGMKMQIDFVLKKSVDLDDFVKGKLQTVLQEIDRTVSTIRNIARNLRPGILDDFGLLAALEWQADEFTKSAGIPVYFQYESDEKPMDNQKATAIFRIFQECLTNIMRHSKCTHVNVGVNFSAREVKLIIEDNGVGFELDELKNTKSLGILGMQERAGNFGGELNIQSAPGQGTKSILIMPYKKNNP